MNFNEDELRAELARANVQINQVRNDPVWRRTYLHGFPDFADLSHNVAPTYNQPVIRQIGDRNNQGTQEAQPVLDASSETAVEAPADLSGAKTASSLSSPSKAKPGDLIVQSMRYDPALRRSY